MLILEVIGGFFSIIGALLISKATNKYLYYAFISFFISNLSLLAFFTLNGKIAMAIQMIIFFITAILGILRLSNSKTEKRKNKSIISLVLGIYFIALFGYILFIGINQIIFEIHFLEAIASAIAIFGSVLLSDKDKNKRTIAYISFVIADILLVYIGYTNMYFVFMLQSALFVVTGSIGLYNNNKDFFDSLNKKKLVY